MENHSPYKMNKQDRYSITKSYQGSTDVTSNSNIVTLDGHKNNGSKDKSLNSGTLDKYSVINKIDECSEENCSSVISTMTWPKMNDIDDFQVISNTKIDDKITNFPLLKQNRFGSEYMIEIETLNDEYPQPLKKMTKSNSKGGQMTNNVTNSDVGTIIQHDKEIFVKKKLRKCLKGWNKFKKHEIKLTRQSGLSNIVYLAEVNAKNCEELEANEDTFIVRLQRKDQVNDASAFNPYSLKIQNYLTSQKIGPDTIYEDNEIKVDEFIRGWQPKKSDMDQQNFRLWMMQPLADFLNNNVDQNDFGGKLTQIHLIEDKKIIDVMTERIIQYNLTEEENITLKKTLSLFGKEEIDFVQSLFKNFNKKDLFLVHGDCYYMNVLYSNRRKCVTYIDFEYGCLNPFVSDIANIATETMFDYGVKSYPFYSYQPENHPSDDQLREMIRALLCFWNNKKLRFESETAAEFDSQLKASDEFYKVSEEAVENYLLVMKKIAVHINYYYVLWTLWDLRNTEMELDYVLYARDRAKSYFLAKKKYLQYLHERSQM